MASVGAELAKWGATLRVELSNRLAYKLNFLLLVIGPVLVFFFIRYSVWSAIYNLEGITTLQGYTLQGMIAYQVWVMVVNFLGQGYNGRNLSLDIRQGRISAYLIYPFGFWAYHASCFFAFQVLQLGVSSFTVVCVWSAGWVQFTSIAALLNGVLFSLCVGLYWFQLSFLLGIISFWLDETWVLRVMMVTVSQFFSGALIPLELFPHWVVSWIYYTPFPYLTYVPAKIFMGEYSGNLLLAYGALLSWTLVIGLFSRYVWNKGLKLYTAAGM